MTIEELKQHCIRQITEFERIKEIMSVTPNDYKRYEEHKIVLQLIETSEQQPCEDAVSRQAVDELSIELVHTTKDKADFLCNFWEGLQKLPSVTPKEKIGTWIDNADKIDAQFGRHTYKCSECGKYAEYFISGTEVWWDRIKPNFCPNCGTRMLESQESEETDGNS